MITHEERVYHYQESDDCNEGVARETKKGQVVVALLAIGMACQGDKENSNSKQKQANNA